MKEVACDHLEYFTYRRKINDDKSAAILSIILRICRSVISYKFGEESRWYVYGGIFLTIILSRYLNELLK